MLLDEISKECWQSDQICQLYDITRSHVSLVLEICVNIFCSPFVALLLFLLKITSVLKGQIFKYLYSLSSSHIDQVVSLDSLVICRYQSSLLESSLDAYSVCTKLMNVTFFLIHQCWYLHV